MGRARLWEDTLILALRDWQWLRHPSTSSPSDSPAQRPTLPPGLVKLDGNAESKIGDLVTSLGDARFFIFEVKSERDRIRDEWVRRGVFRPKLVYQRLKELVDTCNALKGPPNQRSPDEGYLNLWRSISCHHFLYWEGDEKADCVLGRANVEPYILGAIAKRGVHEKTKAETMRRIRGKDRPHIFLGKDLIRFSGLETLNDLRINTLRNLQAGSEPLGLTPVELEAYLRFLCGSPSTASEFSDWEAAAEDVHIVVLSADGGFFRVLTDTNQLVSLIDGIPRPEPEMHASTHRLDRRHPPVRPVRGPD